MSGSARAADVVIAAVATIAAVVAVIAAARTNSGPYGAVIARAGIKINPCVIGSAPGGAWPSLGILLGAALTTAPLAFRRIYPITSFCVIMVAVIATSGHTTSITFAAVICAAYSAVTYSPFRRAALLSVLAAAVIVTAAYPNTSPPVPERFGALLVLLPTVAVGIAIRVWRRRAGESAERLRLAQAGHEAADPPRRGAGAGPYRQRDARRGDAQRERHGGAGRRGPAGAGQLAGRGPRGAAGRRGQRTDRHDRTPAPAGPAGSLRGG